MADAAALAAAAESGDPFALARLEHPDKALVRIVDEGLGWELILAIPRESKGAVFDGDTVIVNRKAEAGAGVPPSSPGQTRAPAPAYASPEPRPRAQ